MHTTKKAEVEQIKTKRNKLREIGFDSKDQSDKMNCERMDEHLGAD